MTSLWLHIPSKLLIESTSKIVPDEVCDPTIEAGITSGHVLAGATSIE